MKVAIASYHFYSACEAYAAQVLDAEDIYLADPSNIIGSDLLILPGGSDISPEIYGEMNIHSSTFVQRDMIEVLMTTIALRNKVSILGFCRGHQLINALVGGKLIQNLVESHGGDHGLEHVVDDPLVNAITEVNSMHHQGVIKLAEGVEGLSKWKNVWELTKSDKYKFVSTQFHPEFGLDRTNDEAVANFIVSILHSFERG